ncbi:MAG: hypothetical protein FJZ90_16080 [Chloroflexi bacterium]|nr:hypothetical protein [Chloroflexota bacterium]MBM4089358.1 hypothetical protein [Planctomycetota bacterium]
MNLLDEQERICRDLDKRDCLQACLGEQATVLMMRGELHRAMTRLREQEEICRSSDDRKSLARCLSNQGLVFKHAGDLDRAMQLHQEEERICQELDDRDQLSRSLGNQALLLAALGDLDRAMALHQRTERICRELDNREGLQVCLGNQALILCQSGELAQAASLLEEQERICRELGYVYGLIICLMNRALLLADDMRRPREGLPRIEEAHRLAQEHGFDPLIHQTEHTLAAIRPRLPAKSRFMRPVFGAQRVKEHATRQPNRPAFHGACEAAVRLMLCEGHGHGRGRGRAFPAVMVSAVASEPRHLVALDLARAFKRSHRRTVVVGNSSPHPFVV